MSEATSVHVIAPEIEGMEPLGWWREYTQLSNIAGVEAKVLGGREATFPAVTEFMRSPCSLLLWSGHGGPNNLMCADRQSLDGDDLAMYARPSMARAVVLSACLSAYPDEDLDSLVMALSQAGMNAVGVMVTVKDAAAITFNIEFVRAMAAGADLARAYRSAQKRMAAISRNCAANAILMPALTNGYRVIADRVDRVEVRVGNMERKLDDVLTLLETRRR